MPIPLLNAYLHELPRLEAQEALRGMSVTALGSGSVKKQDSQRIVASWQRTAAGQATAAKSSASALRGLIGTLGVPMEVVPAKSTSEAERDA